MLMLNARVQRGVTLLESLISMGVLAMGVMGLLQLQLRTMVDSQSAKYAMVAARVADELFERIKANPSADIAFNSTYVPTDPANSHQWAWLTKYEVEWGKLPGNGISIGTDCTTAACDTDNQAKWDLYQWKSSFVVNASSGISPQSLPNADARVVVSPDNPRQLIAIIGWRDGDKGTPPAPPKIPNVVIPAACGTTHTCLAVYGGP
jgi:type IV pilus assembly protein PilV